MSINEIFMIVWAVVFLLTIIVELATTELVSIWFSAGAFISFFFCLSGKIPFYVSIIVFFAVSSIFLLLFTVFFKKKMEAKSFPTNYESLLGREVTVFEVLNDRKNGLCKIGDVVWMITSPTELTVGDIKKIKNIEGNRLIAAAEEEK